MPNEIERKFLVKEMPRGLGDYLASEINQGYLAVTDDDTEIRIRKKGDGYYETVKSGKGLKRKEVEIEIGEKVFNALWPLTEGMRVEKTRYDIPYGGHVVELDVYSGGLAGLVVAEVEFADGGRERKVHPSRVARQGDNGRHQIQQQTPRALRQTCRLIGAESAHIYGFSLSPQPNQSCHCERSNIKKKDEILNQVQDDEREIATAIRQPRDDKKSCHSRHRSGIQFFDRNW